MRRHSLLFAAVVIGVALTALLPFETPVAAGGSRPGMRPPGTAARLGARGGLTVLDGISYENITLFPVLATVDADTNSFLTLDEALAAGEVTVAEMSDAALRRSRDGRPVQVAGDQVNRLVLVNRSRRPLLLLAGEVVSGGKQDRVIARDRLVAPGADPLPLDVFCVEHGRWTGASQFTASKIIVHPSVREQAVIEQKQDRVWSAVRSGTTAAAAPAGAGGRAAMLTPDAIGQVIAGEAPSESYAKVYQGSRLAHGADSFAAELDRRVHRAVSERRGAHLVGVVVAYGGEVAWSDLFPSAELLDKYWSKLLRSYVVEALARPATAERASQDAAVAFLEPVQGREQVETEPGLYRWRQVTSGHDARIDLEFLPKSLALHTVRVRRTS